MNKAQKTLQKPNKTPHNITKQTKPTFYLQMRSDQSGDGVSSAIWAEAAGQVQTFFRHNLGGARQSQSRKQSDPGNIHIYFVSVEIISFIYLSSKLANH